MKPDLELGDELARLPEQVLRVALLEAVVGVPGRRAPAVPDRRRQRGDEGGARPGARQEEVVRGEGGGLISIEAIH